MEPAKRKLVFLGGVVLLAAALAGIGLLVASRNAPPALLLSGTVTDAATGRPIAGATVSDDGYGTEPPRGGVTDATGEYQYATWPEEHFIIARAPGYLPERRLLRTDLGGTERRKVVNFELTPQ